MSLKKLHEEIKACTACPLHEKATQKVLIRGCQKDKSKGISPDILFVGEAPGADEDEQGKPFVGLSGKMLQDAIDAAGLASYAIVNTCKCRPPENRDPTMQEKLACSVWLERQIAILKPKIIAPVGRHAMEYFMPKAQGITKMAGQLHDEKYFVLVHPSYYLRNRSKSGELTQHMKRLAGLLEQEESTSAEEFAEHPRINWQVAENQGKFEMISPQLAAIHLLCNKSNIPFKNKNQKDLCFVGDKEVLITDSPEKIKERGIVYKIDGGNFVIESIYPTPNKCKKPTFLFKIPKSEVEDVEPAKYVPLHCHTQYSIGDGYGKPKDIAEVAYKKGFSAYACTDHGTFQGCIYMQKALLLKNIKPLLGVEAYVITDDIGEKDRTRYHMTLLAKNEKGWKRLLQLQDDACRKHFYYRPLMKFEDIIAEPDGIIAMTACMGGILSAPMLKEDKARSKKYFQALHKAFGDDLYLEIMPNGIPQQTKVNKFLLKIAEKSGVKCVCTNDVHYMEREDEKVHRAIKAIGMRKKYDESGFDTDEFYMHTSDEMMEEFNKNHPYISRKQVEEMMANTFEVANKIDFMLKFEQFDSLPKLYKEPNKKLREMTLKGLEANTPYKYEGEIKERIDLELDRYISKHYANYFLVVEEYVKWCKDNGIAVGPGRGSVGGSLVAYALGITDTDPIKYNLLFDRFCSEIRKDMPDVDLDFQDTRRVELHDHLREKYGDDHVCKIVTFSTWHGKGAIRDIGRIFNLPAKKVHKVASLVITRSGGDARSDFCLMDTFEEFEQAKEFYRDYKEACDIAVKLEGHIRHRGVHAAGIVITENPISEYVPIEKLKGEYVTAWEKREIETVGLIKFDILGLKTLSVITQTLDYVGKTWDDLPKEFEDPLVYEKVFSIGKTLGTFQMETTGMQKHCKQLGVDSFKKLYDMNALYRPGSLHSGQTAEYILRANGKEWEYDHPLLEPITEETFGQILYQEQVMQVMFDLGKFSWATAESSRKIMTKSKGADAFNKMRKEFVANAKKEHGLSAKEAGGIFDVVSTFGSYGFNKSHSVEYSILSYWTAWLKVYHPQAFFASLLTREDDGAKIADYIRDAKSFGVSIKTPDVNGSNVGYNITASDIVAGFDAVKGIGKKSAEKLIKNQPYEDLAAFIKSKPSKTIWERLVMSGALDSLEPNRKWLFDNRQELMKKTGKPGPKGEDWTEKEKAMNMMSVIDMPTEKPAINYFDNPVEEFVKMRPISDLEFKDFEFGYWIKGMVTFINFKQEGLEGQWTMFDSVLERRYAHLNVNDGTSNILVHLSPEQYTYYKKYMERGAGFPVAIYGHNIKDYQKVYADAMLVLDDFDEDNPAFKYFKDGRQEEIDELKERYKNLDVEVSVIDSVSYKVSKKGKPYARIKFMNDDGYWLCFNLTEQIFVAGEVLAWSSDQEPFISLLARK